MKTKPMNIKIYKAEQYPTAQYENITRWNGVIFFVAGLLGFAALYVGSVRLDAIQLMTARILLFIALVCLIESKYARLVIEMRKR